MCRVVGHAPHFVVHLLGLQVDKVLVENRYYNWVFSTLYCVSECTTESVDDSRRTLSLPWILPRGLTRSRMLLYSGPVAMQEAGFGENDDSENLRGMAELSPWAQFMSAWNNPVQIDADDSDVGVRAPKASHFASSAAENLSSQAIHSPRDSIKSIWTEDTKCRDEQRWEDYQRGFRQGESPLPLFMACELRAPEFILPPLQRNGSFKKTLVLDLDQTLIDCALVNVIPHSQPSHFVYKDSCGGRAQVWCRPGLHEFLTAVSKVFEVVLFTAAGQRHADAVLDFIDPTRTLFHHRLYQQHTSPDPDWPWVKDLRRLGRDLGSTLIIDDCEKAAIATPENWVGIKPFSQATPFWSNDKALNEILHFLTDKVLPASDVRPVISNHYNNLLRKPRMLLSSPSSKSPSNNQDQDQVQEESGCKHSLMRVQRFTQVHNFDRYSLPGSLANSGKDVGEGEDKPGVNVIEC